MATAILALGLVLCVEGLLFALAPRRLDDALDALRRMDPDMRRAIGLGALALGASLVWIARALGA